MNWERYILLYKKFTNRNLKLIIYLLFTLFLLLTIFFSYNNVYKTAINPKKIDESEIIAKKQKVDINLFKEIEKKIDEKDVNSTNDISNFFN